MKSEIYNYVRSELRAFGAYSAAKAPDEIISEKDQAIEHIIKLDQNENLYGCSPKVHKALAEYQTYNIYPDANQGTIRKQLAAYTGADASSIVAASGSNTLLDMITRLFVSPGDSVINCVPTFDLYRFSTQVCGGKLIEVQRDDNFDLDIQAIKKAVNKNTKLIFLANPNAPTGNLATDLQIREILEIGLPTVVDEAYYEFSGATALPLTKTFGNLMLLRTFSKWAGLAGLRVGYGIFPPAIADYLHKIKIPYNVNVAALVAVSESMKDIDYLMNNVRKIIIDRDILFNKLKTISWLKVYPSSGNYFLCLVLKGKASSVQEKLQKKGILVRYFEAPRINNCIRISVGKSEDTEILIKALKEISTTL
jgi:histidinol-phosphate aminotransferase